MPVVDAVAITAIITSGGRQPLPIRDIIFNFRYTSPPPSPTIRWTAIGSDARA
jgi:hypothetical protein